MSSHFCHLHCHTQFSLLDGATDISSMMKKAKEDGMMAVALTDHGNMFGCFDFVKEAEKIKLNLYSAVNSIWSKTGTSSLL